MKDYFIPDKKWRDNHVIKELITIMPCSICHDMVIVRGLTGAYGGSFAHDKCLKEHTPFVAIELDKDQK